MKVKNAEADKKAAPTEDDLSEDEKAKIFKADVETLANTATKKRNIKDVKKYTEAIENDPTSEIKKEKLAAAKTAVKADEIKEVDD